MDGNNRSRDGVNPESPTGECEARSFLYEVNSTSGCEYELMGPDASADDHHCSLPNANF